MVCKVCKRELNSPICSFCGEDNSSLFDNKDAGNIRNSDSKVKKTEYRKKAKSNINIHKLVKTILFLTIIVIVVFSMIKLVKKLRQDDTPKGKSMFSSDMLAVSVNGELGYISYSEENTASLTLSIKPQFKHVSDFHGERAAVLIGDKFTLIDTDGFLISEPQYEAIGSFSSNGYIAAKQGGQWGYIDKDCNWVVRPKFSAAGAFSVNKTAPVSVSGSYGYIGEDGEYVIAPQYEMAFEFSSNNMAAVKSSGKWGYIDKSGKSIINPHFDEAYKFENGIATVCVNKNYGIIDEDGNYVIAPQFDEYFSFGAFDYARVKIGNKYGYIDKGGIYKINPKYKDLGEFGYETLTYAQDFDGKYGFINLDDKFIIKPQFDNAGSFSLGKAPVCKSGLWGYIDESGKTVIDMSYSHASQFYSEDYAIVSDLNNKFSIINSEGKPAVNTSSEFDYIIDK